MASRNPACTPDYSPAFKRITGFRGTPTGISHGHGNPITEHTRNTGPGTLGIHGPHASLPKKSALHPYKAGGKKPTTGKS